MYNKHSGMSAEDKDSSTLKTHDVFAGNLAAYVYFFASIVQVGFEMMGMELSVLVFNVVMTAACCTF